MNSTAERLIILACAVVIPSGLAIAVAHSQKPQEVHEHPAVVVRAAPAPASVAVPAPFVLPPALLGAAPVLSRAEQRAANATWPGLTQLEINHLQMALQDVPADQRGWITIFCENDAYCGDLQSDFENAFETAHWPTATEKPLLDTTLGISTSSPALKEAIEKATRLKVAMIPKGADYFALVIGRRVGKPGITVAPLDAGHGEVIASQPEATPAPAEQPVAGAEKPAEPIASVAVVTPVPMPVAKPKHKHRAKRKHRRHGAMHPCHRHWFEVR